MSTSRRRRAREARRDMLVIVTLTVLVLAALGAAGYWFKGNLDQRKNPVSLCPESSKPNGHIVLLIDTTDPLTFTQKRAVKQRLEHIASKEVREGQLLSLFVFGEDYKTLPDPVFEKCNPGSAEGKSEWTANLKRIDQKYQKDYLQPLRDASEIVFADRPGAQSPIMEMLQMVAINGFRRHGIEGDLRLIVVSDMLHNTKGYSLYRGDQEFSEFRKTAYYQRIRTEFPRVKVEIDYLMHSPELQRVKNALFWEEYFDDAKAALGPINTIEG